MLAVLRPFDHVEDDQDRLVGLRGLAEEAANRGVVELLLGQDRDQDIGRMADQPGPVPVHGNGTVHVRRVEEHEVGRLDAGRVLAVDQAVGRPLRDRVILGRPGTELERREDPLQVVALGEPARQQADRMPRLGRVGMNPAGGKADQVIEHRALADVRPASHGDDEVRGLGHLGQELLEQVGMPGGRAGRRHAQGSGLRLQTRDRLGQVDDPT